MSDAVQTNFVDKDVAPSSAPVPFATVLGEELEIVRKRRGIPDDADVTEDLSGLALSGGGIRSAAFSLGVLQGLAELGLLGRFDYLSTVSGGGYIGAWYSRWIHEAGQAKVLEELRRAAKRGDRTKEPPEIQHIRDYSNFLTPRPGLFSADGWTLIAIYLRNLILNQAVLLLAVIAVLCAVLATAQSFALICHLTSVRPEWSEMWKVLVLIGITIGLAARACVVTMRRLAVSDLKLTADPAAAKRGADRIWQKPALWYLLTTVGVSACSLQPIFHKEIRLWHNDWVPHLMLPLVGAVMGGWVARAASRRNQRLLTIGAGLLAGAICGVVWDAGLNRLLVWSAPETRPTSFTLPTRPNSTTYVVPVPVTGSTFVATMATFGPPLGLLCVTLSMFLTIGFGGRGFSEHDRERWSRLSSHLMMVALAWGALFFLVLFGPYLSMQLLTSSWWYSAIAGTGWLSIVGAGLRFASGARTGQPGQAGVRDLVARFAAPLFLVALLLFVATGFIYIGYEIYATTNTADDYRFRSQWPHLLHNLDDLRSWVGGIATPQSHMMVMASVLGFGGLSWLLARWLGYRVGVNRFSLNALYANRITRCFIAAARRDRNPDPDIDFDENDDIRLSDLRTDGRNDAGPIHLINTALNRRGHASDRTSGAGGKTVRSALLERKAESFILSPLYCGSEATGYRDASTFSGEPDLGTAVAVSGAAVSPNMGYHSDPLVRVFLTLFNLRLGAWFKSPRRAESRGETDTKVPSRWAYNPAAASKLLWRELFGRVDTARDEVYLSDGGHFENMGVYELLRRRCRYIVAVDAGADPEFQENIGRLVRLARIDLGVEIELDPTIVTPDEKNRTNTHMLAGRIHYRGIQATRERRDPTFNPGAEVDGEPAQGVILWFKNALTGDESGDVKHYAATHPKFPYESTTDQFFSESQFESYRALGLHTIRATLGRIPEAERLDAARDLLSAANSTVTAIEPTAVTKSLAGIPLTHIFGVVHDNWLRLPHGAVRIYVEGNDEYAHILGQLRQEPLLAKLYEQVYGSGGGATAATESDAEARDRHRAEETAIGQMFALLEGVWMALDLDQNELHPIYGGWMQLIDHWLTADRVQRFWAIGPYKQTAPKMQAEFSQAFRAFIKRRYKRLAMKAESNPPLADNSAQA
jgi:predicted acylesterase/phospholipase RssA